MASDDVTAGDEPATDPPEVPEEGAEYNPMERPRDGFVRIELHRHGARAFVDIPDDTYGAIRDFGYIFDDLDNAIDRVATEQTGQ